MTSVSRKIIGGRLAAAIELGALTVIGATMCAAPAFAQSWDVEQTYTPGAAWTAAAPWEARRASGTYCTNDLGIIGTSWTASGASLPGVSAPNQVNGHFLPVIFKNTTSIAVTPPQMTVYASQVALHPGTDCAVLRFKAPTNGVYNVNGEFFAPTGTIHPQHVNVRVLDKGVQVHAGVVDKPGGIQNWAIPASTYSLEAGESIDFAVDMGKNYFWGDTVLLSARVTKMGDLSNAFKAADFDFEGNHGCAKEQGSNKLYCWGMNGWSQLGNTSSSNSNKAVSATRIESHLTTNSLGSVSNIQVGQRNVCVRTTAQATLCWGSNDLMESGAPTGGTVQVQDVTAQTAGYHKLKLDGRTGCLVMIGGTVKCWGGNKVQVSNVGQLGWKNGSWNHNATPLAAVPNVSGATDVSQGVFSCAVTGTAGNVVCWGNTAWGPQVMGGGWTPTPLPHPDGLFQSYVKVAGGVNLAGVTKVEVGGVRACGLKSGKLFCWGLNATYGNLAGAPVGGTGSPPNVLFEAVAMSGPFANGVNDFSLAGGSVCAVSGASAQVFCQGQNNKGQLGKSPVGANKWRAFTAGYANANVTYDISPLPGLTNITKIRGGSEGYCALKSVGEIWCWGAGALGSLGNGASVDSAVPVRVIK